MRLTRVFCEPEVNGAGSFVIDGESAAHLLKVMRLRCGQEFTAFDNSGAEYRCRVADVSARGTSLRADVLEKSFPDLGRRPKVCFYLAPAKGERADWAVEKLTELGVDRIVPLITEYTQNGAASDSKIERWRRLARSAAEQSGRVRLPDIASPLSFAEALEECRSEAASVSENKLHMVFFHPGGKPFEPVREAGVIYCVFIGPEGGFSDSETEAASRYGCEICGLGRLILRVETAACAAAAKFL